SRLDATFEENRSPLAGRLSRPLRRLAVSLVVDDNVMKFSRLFPLAIAGAEAVGRQAEVAHAHAIRCVAQLWVFGQPTAEGGPVDVDHRFCAPCCLSDGAAGGVRPTAP